MNVRRWIQASLALALGLALGACAGSARKVSHFDTAVYLLKQGKSDDAIKEFQASLTIDPDDPHVHNAMAEALYARGFREQAIESWEKALGTGSIDPAFYQKGGRARSAEWIADGILGYKMAVSGAAKAWMEQALEEYEKSQWPKAAELWNKVVKYDNSNLEAWMGIGMAAKKLKDRQQGFLAWRACSKLKSEEPRFWKWYGYDAFATDQMNDAELAFRKYTDLEPQRPKGFVNLGAVLIKLERYDEAEKAFDKALENKGDSPEALDGKAQAIYYLKRYEEAKKFWGMVLELQPDHVSAKENIRTLVRMGY